VCVPQARQTKIPQAPKPLPYRRLVRIRRMRAARIALLLALEIAVLVADDDLRFREETLNPARSHDLGRNSRLTNTSNDDAELARMQMWFERHLEDMEDSTAIDFPKPPADTPLWCRC
jgi:hypothetical protein